MRRIVYSLLFLSTILAFSSCSSDLTLGFTPANLPVTLSLNKSGVHVSFAGALYTPLGTFSLTATLPESLYNQHVTYIELINRIDGKKVVIPLQNIGESVRWESTNCVITVTNRSYSTIVTVESDKITNFLHKENGKDAGYKPDFPETPLRYFYLVKTLNSKVNWEIHSIADFVGDIFFGIIWMFALFIDLFLIVSLFVLRFLWWIIKLLGYLFGIG